ncbi:hypothetical protein LY71_102192 [Geodermatophilus tzadiensis]|uniref:Glyoxalase-like domain-containing protein n=1 Tax=Geodermatophilus tzadiensis TaxID=1137988 RepID=A0A2T0TZP6_9ACTN|nr:VOC family protein [Geodermatophilus tzadiensis]PRY51129.1 hypothetical protein LY71_102192 [Geodermatophilus tzadiensis]
MRLAAGPARGAGPQQVQTHLDLEVDDLDATGALAEETGARRLVGCTEPHEDVRVHADPDGHPFRLLVRPENGSPPSGDAA